MDPCGSLPRRATDVLHADEIRALTRPSDLAGALVVLGTWAGIAATFALVALWPHPLTILVALVILGGRHMALAVLMHETAHRSLFASRRLGEWVGRWLCAAPGGNDLVRYRVHHLAHHAHTGTERDPDIALTRPFPITGRSLARKLLRDLSGLTGLRRVVGILLMDIGVLGYTASSDPRPVPREQRSARSMLQGLLTRTGPTLVANAVLLAVLTAVGHPALYLLWVVSYLTTYSVFLRIRSIAEHACTQGGPNPFLNTRTILAGTLARLTVAPVRVNYHLEHHLLMTVPYHRLPQLHARLRERGVFEHAALAPSYRAVLTRATSRG
ncbi:MAG: fatty acid desaturase family protein [Myxococcota bacterium]